MFLKNVVKSRSGPAEKPFENLIVIIFLENLVKSRSGHFSFVMMLVEILVNQGALDFGVWFKRKFKMNKFNKTEFFNCSTDKSQPMFGRCEVQRKPFIRFYLLYTIYYSDFR